MRIHLREIRSFADTDLRVAGDLHVHGPAVPLQVHRISEDHQVPVPVVLHGADRDGVPDIDGDRREVHRGLPSAESQIILHLWTGTGGGPGYRGLRFSLQFTQVSVIPARRCFLPGR